MSDTIATVKSKTELWLNSKKYSARLMAYNGYTALFAITSQGKEDTYPLEQCPIIDALYRGIQQLLQSRQKG